MILGGILLMLVCIGALILIKVFGNKNEDMGFIIFISMVLFCGFAVFLLGIAPERYLHTKDNSLRTEIKVEMINGIETSRDTVYIFTPRKKK